MKTMKFLISIFALLSFIPVFAGNQEDVNSLFQKANEYYAKGDYAKSIELYQNILSQGYKSKEVLFNLGNAYYRLGEYHKAILYYERAKILDPFDEDINFNLQMANLHNIDKIQEIPKFFLQQWWEGLRDSLASHQWATISIVAIWLAAISLSVFLLVLSSSLRRISFFAGIFFILLFLGATILGYSRYKFETSHTYAIVFSTNSYIKSSPEETSTDLFILHLGTKVQILDEIGNWYKIRLANGNLGWIKKQDLERI